MGKRARRNDEKNCSHDCWYSQCMSSLTFARTFARVLRRDLKEINQVSLQRVEWSLLAKWGTPSSACFQTLHMGEGNVLDWWELVLSFSNMKWQIIIGRRASCEQIRKSGQAAYVNVIEKGEPGAVRRDSSHPLWFALASEKLASIWWGRSKPVVIRGCRAEKFSVYWWMRQLSICGVKVKKQQTLGADHMWIRIEASWCSLQPVHGSRLHPRSLFTAPSSVSALAILVPLETVQQPRDFLPNKTYSPVSAPLVLFFSFSYWPQR